MVQIGEFAFIIAGLGQELGVTSQFLYPVVVAVSIITTFLTPYAIKFSPKAASRIESSLSTEIQSLINRGKTLKKNSSSERSEGSVAFAWRDLLSAVLFQTAAYLTISIAILMFSYATILPLFKHMMGEWYGTLFCGVVTLLLLSPCIRPIVIKKNHSSEVKYLLSSGGMNAFLVRLILFAKAVLGFLLVYDVVFYVSPIWWVWNVLISVAVLALMVVSRIVKYTSIRMERTFKQNLRLREQQNVLSYGRRLRGKDLQIARVKIPAHSRWGGKTLAQLHFGKTDRVHVAAILRSGHRINIPGGGHRVYPGDILEVVAGSEAIESLRLRSEQEVLPLQERNKEKHNLSIISIQLSESSPLIGNTLQDIDFRLRYHCMVVGVENTEGHIGTIPAKRQFAQGDIVWVVGEEADLSMLSMVI